ncbi:hypothetical protein PFISCL1PPCAC_980, partial [Pristionchus fissidentatus]
TTTTSTTTTTTTTTTRRPTTTTPKKDCTGCPPIPRTLPCNQHNTCNPNWLIEYKNKDGCDVLTYRSPGDNILSQCPGRPVLEHRQIFYCMGKKHGWRECGYLSCPWL